MSQEKEEEEEHEASFAASFSEPNIGSTFVDSKRRSFFEPFSMSLPHVVTKGQPPPLLHLAHRLLFGSDRRSENKMRVLHGFHCISKS